MTKEEQTKPTEETQKKGFWAELSSDSQQPESEKENSDNQDNTQKPQEGESKPTQQTKPTQQKKSHEPRIKQFDPRVHLRGAQGNMKTVKGGFKPEKLQKKKFHLDAVANPFAFGQQDSEEQQQPEKQKETEQVKESVEDNKNQGKKLTKKQQKKKEQQELEATLKQFGVQQKGEEKKKKKKKAKKATDAVQQKTQQKKVQQAQQAPVQNTQFTVDISKLQEVLKQKAKPTKKKESKASVATNAGKKAIQQREAKNKAKKVFVDL